MKTQELLKLLKRGGCTFVKHGKKHDLWISPKTGKKFFIPRHAKEMAVGTVESILRDAGL